jgi:hypothetical protein
MEKIERLELIKSFCRRKETVAEIEILDVKLEDVEDEISLFRSTIESNWRKDFEE